MPSSATKKALVVFSSRKATGNSEKIARAVAAALGSSCEIHSAGSAPSPAKFDFVIMAFGVYHGWPDGAMRAFMRTCKGKDVALLISLGAYPDSEHAKICLGRAEGLLDSCAVKAKSISHGRIDPALVARMKTRPAGSPHSWDSERAERVAAAETHPDARDLAKASELCLAAWTKIAGEELASDEPQKKKAVLLAAFGTAFESARGAYENIERVVASARPGAELRWAYSSGMVRAKLRAKGIDAKSPSDALDSLKLDCFESVEIMPLYMTPGEEHHKLLSVVAAFRNHALGFDELRVGKTLMSSAKALDALCEAVLSGVPRERKPGEALVLMGHGNADGRSDLLYIAAAAKMAELDPLAFVACVEGEPSFDAVEKTLLAHGVKKAFLIPFMIVAGDHALNDMAGDEEDSWKSRLQARGVECHCVTKGLGENDAVAKLFLR